MQGGALRPEILASWHNYGSTIDNYIYTYIVFQQKTFDVRISLCLKCAWRESAVKYYINLPDVCACKTARMQF